MGRSWFLVALAIASGAPREAFAQARSMVCSPDQAELEWDPQTSEPRCMVETVVKGEDWADASEASRKSSRDACFKSATMRGRASSVAYVACGAIGMRFIEKTEQHVDSCRVTSHPPHGKGGLLECACPVIGYCRPKKTKQDNPSSPIPPQGTSPGSPPTSGGNDATSTPCAGALPLPGKPDEYLTRWSDWFTPNPRFPSIDVRIFCKRAAKYSGVQLRNRYAHPVEIRWHGMAARKGPDFTTVLATGVVTGDKLDSLTSCSSNSYDINITDVKVLSP